MSLRLGYDKHSPVGRNKGNSRNGSTPKTVTTEVGQLTVQVPRDREGSFEPKVIAKHQRRLSGFDEQVVSLYAKGMTTGGIVAHLEPIYDTNISRDTVSAVTSKTGAPDTSSAAEAALPPRSKPTMSASSDISRAMGPLPEAQVLEGRAVQRLAGRDPGSSQRRSP